MPDNTREDREAELLAIPDPIERAAAITAYGRTRRLTPALADQRKADIALGRINRPASEVAKLINLAKSGIHRLAPLGTTRQQGATS